MIDPTASRWQDGPLVCTVERNGLRARASARYAWRVTLPEGDAHAWPPGSRLIAHGTAPDVDAARLDCQNAAQDWLKTQPAARTECP